VRACVRACVRARCVRVACVGGGARAVPAWTGAQWDKTGLVFSIGDGYW
jgi:hypothetical protein